MILSVFFSFNSLFLFPGFSNSIGTIKNMEQTSYNATIIASVVGVIIFLVAVSLAFIISHR